MKKSFRNMSKVELQSVLKGKRDALRSLRFKLTKGKVKNMKEAREIKKDIARILTHINYGK